MAQTDTFGEVAITEAARFVYRLSWSRPPNNFIDAALVRGIASALEALDENTSCRVAILAPEGKHFCAGANLAGRERASDDSAASTLYSEARRLFRTKKPVIAAVNGAAIGGGLGLAVAADFRVVADSAKLSANFSRLGYFPGFALTYTLPRLIGRQAASRLFYTSRRITANEAREAGLADLVVPGEKLAEAALHLAMEIASAGPLSVMAIRSHLRSGVYEQVDIALEREAAEQKILRATGDFAEGVRATAERRLPDFTGR